MKKLGELLAAAGGAVVSFFVQMPPLVWILIAVMTIDYVTGLIVAALGRSTKTENGYVSSHAAFIGLLKKACILLVVLMASLLDMAITNGTGIQIEAVVGATCLWFIASEGFSVVENMAVMGVPVPKILLKVLEIMKEKGDAPDSKPEEPTEGNE